MVASMNDFSDPATVFWKAIGALASEDFETVAACIDPYSLREFHSEVGSTESFRSIRDRGNRDSDDARFAQTLETLHGVQTPGPREMFIAWLRWASPRSKAWRLVETGEISSETAEAFCSPVPPVRLIELVGVVVEHDRFAHILFRAAITPPTESWLNAIPPEDRPARSDQWSFGRVSVSQARRQPDSTWRLWASRHFLSYDSSLTLSSVARSRND